MSAGAAPGVADSGSRVGSAGICGSVDIWRPLEHDGWCSALLPAAVGRDEQEASLADQLAWHLPSGPAERQLVNQVTSS
jgi:hypothetical protein